MTRRSDPIPILPEGPSVRTLRRRFLAALALVGLIAVGEFAAMQALIAREADRAAMLDQTSRQRTLVQRAAVITHELLRGDSSVRDSLRDELAGVVGEIQSWHAQAIHDGDLPPTLEAAFFDEPLQLDSSIHVYLRHAERLIDGPDSLLARGRIPVRWVLSAASGGTSATLDHVVEQLVAESDAAIRRAERTSQAMLLGLLVLLMVIALAMFRPALHQLEWEHNLRTRAWEELKALSTQDALTAIPNRRAFDQRFDEEWRRAQRERHTLALLMADIDHFKPYNDEYGHQRGDDCLRRIAATLARNVARPADFVARYGGEEFAIILPQTTDVGAHAVAETLREAVEELGLTNARNSGPVTISVGIAIITPVAEDGPDDLVAAADRALYRAKQNGRNRVETATTG